MSSGPLRSDLPSVDQWDLYWEEFADANQLNPAQEFRRRLVLGLLERDGAPRRLLDIGSGTGELLAAAESRWPGSALLGLELSQSAVARSRAKLPGARFRAVDLLSGAAPEAGEQRWATHACCSEVLEHVDDPVALLRAARSWLAPGCRIVVTVPGGPMSAFDRHIGHRRHFRPAELADLMSAAGLEVRSAWGAGFPFFNLYRGLVILRGERLVLDAKPEAHGSLGATGVRAAMHAFRWLLRLTVPRYELGWQTVGVAREPIDAGTLGT